MVDRVGKLTAVGECLFAHLFDLMTVVDTKNDS